MILGAATGLRAASSVDELLSRRPDAVVVATPPQTHAALATRALARGHHVFVEKPMAVSVAEAEGLWRAVAQSRARLMVGHVALFNPGFIFARHCVAQGALGKLRLVASERSGRPSASGDGNAWWTLGPHDVSAALELCSARVTRVAVARARWAADTVLAQLDIAGGEVRALMALGGNAGEKRRRLLLVGDRASLEIVDHGFSATARWYGSEAFGGNAALWFGASCAVPPLREVPVPFDVEPLVLETSHFVDGALYGLPFRADHKHGFDVVSVLSAGQASLHCGGDWMYVSYDFPSRARGPASSGQGPSRADRLAYLCAVGVQEDVVKHD